MKQRLFTMQLRVLELRTTAARLLPGSTRTCPPTRISIDSKASYLIQAPAGSSARLPVLLNKVLRDRQRQEGRSQERSLTSSRSWVTKLSTYFKHWNNASIIFASFHFGVTAALRNLSIEDVDTAFINRQYVMLSIQFLHAGGES
jgi:hypothetical protein